MLTEIFNYWLDYTLALSLWISKYPIDLFGSFTFKVAPEAITSSIGPEEAFELTLLEICRFIFSIPLLPIQIACQKLMSDLP